MTESERKYLRQCYEAASHSPDPSTQNGVLLCTVLDGQFTEYNRPSVRLTLTPEQWADRDVKLARVEHAERNAIYAAAWSGYSTYGATMYACWASCAECARAIIAAGIRELVAHKHPAQDYRPEWSASIAAGDAMFAEAGVIVRRVEGRLGVKIRFGGRETEV